MRVWTVQKAYCRDIERWQGKGWEPTRNATGAIVAHDSPTGAQTWVVRPPASSGIWTGGVTEGD